MTARTCSRVALICAATVLAGSCARAAPDPASADARLAEAYAHALQALAPAGARALRTSQQAWRRHADRTCAAAHGSGSGDASSEAACLAAAVGDRIEELDDSTTRVGANVLTRIDRFSSVVVPRDPMSGRTLATSHRAYPQIDGPTSAAALAWNRALAQEPLTGYLPGSPTDIDRDYVVGCASDRVLSLRFETVDFPHGAPHPTTTLKVRDVVFDPAPRDMTPDDLFAPDSRWATRLPDLLWQAYLDDGGPFATDPSFEANVRATATKSDHWLLTPQGLQFGFSSYEAGCYACGPGDLTIPWSALEPLLAPAARPACSASPGTDR
jgi:uncharacterized protein YecT (DUF1311 family)